MVSGNGVFEKEPTEQDMEINEEDNCNDCYNEDPTRSPEEIGREY